jgi:hypothetical protein
MNLTEKQKQLAASIIDRDFSTMDMIELFIDLHNTGESETPTYKLIKDEFDVRVLTHRKYDYRLYSFHMEKLLNLFFHQFVFSVFMKKYHKQVVEAISSQPLFDDEYMCKYNEFSSSIAEDILEELNIPYSWNDTDDCDC